MKRFCTLTCTLALLAFAILTFLPHSFAQGTAPKHMVRLVYFLPNDRPAQPHKYAQLRQVIKSAQRFFADEMQRRGFGRKTFTFESNKDGEPFVHRVTGRFAEQHYIRLTGHKAGTEIREHFRVPDLRHVYLIAIDLSNELIGGKHCGEAGVTFLPASGELPERLYSHLITQETEIFGGFAVIPASGHCLNVKLVAHELGHAFGLGHDFREGIHSGNYVMGYGNQTRLSECAAEWLSVSRFFNTNPISEGTPGEIQMLSKPTYSPEGIRLHFEVTDPDGLHQAQLLLPDPRGELLSDCKQLAGKTRKIEFISTELTKVPSNSVMLQIIDVDGNITYETFTTNIAALLPAGQNFRQTVEVEDAAHPPLYWINTVTGTLHRLVGAEVEDIVPSVRNATSLAVNVTGGKLYWTERTSNKRGKIKQANLDGTNVRLVKDLTSVPHSITLDTPDGKIYLTNSWGKVQRLNVDGSNFQTNLITDLDAPQGLALDISGSKVYWAERSGHIRRANLDGSNVEDVATGLEIPMNIVVSDSHVYWTVKTGEDRGEIQFASLHGNPKVVTRTTFTRGFPIGIAVDAVADKLYWTTSRGEIGRSNLHGGNFQPNFVTGLTAPGSIAVAGAFGSGAAASPPGAYQRGLMPEQFLMALIPKATGLLPNYPNPFNPETWIPYRLAKPADVTLRIYATNGALVRTLELGHQSAGTYHSKSRAAYWDGRNTLDERVASGLYFYTFTAGDFTATRKLLIRK